MAQAAVTNTFIIQMNFRLLYFAMENIKSTKLHDRNYWNRLQSIMYEQIETQYDTDDDVLLQRSSRRKQRFL